MKMPGILPLALFLFAVPAVLPVIERFWPTSTVWWSALLVSLLGAAASALWVMFRKPLSDAGLPQPSAQAAPAVDGDDYAYNKPTPKQASKARTWLLG